MHAEAYQGTRRHILALYGSLDVSPRVLDIGGKYVNGSVHDLLPHAKWTVMDLVQGDGVDLVADATTYRFQQGEYDLVVCNEVLEHVQDWHGVLQCCRSAATNLVLTCASTHRHPHGAWGAPSPGPDEWYNNVDPALLMSALHARYSNVVVEYRAVPGDAYAHAWS